MINIIEFIKWKIRGEFPTKKLIERGLLVGDNFNRQQECIIDPSHCWLISIGNNVTLAPRVHILAHDASTKYHLGYAKIGLVNIGNDVIIGAGSIVTSDIPSGYVAVGNPARVICKTEEYLNKNKELMENRPKYDETWTLRYPITHDKKKKMIESLRSGIGYVE